MCAINFAGYYKQDVYVNRYGYTSAQAAQIHDRIKLAHELPDRRGFVEENWAKTIDEQWDAHHAKDFIVSDTIGDYQVFRIFDIEIDHTYDYTERMNEEEQQRLKEIEANYEEDSREYDDAIQELDSDVLNRLYEEEGSANFSLDTIGEYAQLWYNVKTQEKYWLGKIYKGNANYCDFNAEWELLDGSTNDKQTFENRFAKISDSHYIDLSVHADLQAVGYTGIDASDWWYGCGEDENESEAFKYFKNVVEKDGWESFVTGLVHYNGSGNDTNIKAYGLWAVMKSYGMADDYKSKYLAATKIARRNKYNIADQQLWDDMVGALIWLEKDVHNAKYVCPENLKADHDRWTNLMARHKAEIEMKKRIAEAEKMEAQYNEFAEKYFDINITTEHLNIFVCPNVKAMAEEGTRMHHCVFANGYYKAERNCLILFVRDKQGGCISTMELNRSTWAIVQNRGLQNHVPQFDDEARKAVTRNIHLFRNAGKNNVKIVSITNNLITQAA